MTNQQVAPEALHLATASNAMADEGEMIHLLSWHEIRNLLRANAAELRRQHAECEALRVERERNLNSIRVCNEIINKKNAEFESLSTGYAAARLEIESLQARIKTMAEEHADELMVAHLDGRSQAAQQPAPSAAVASKAVLAAIRAANMQLVRTGDDEFMLVTLKQATPQADSQPAPDEATAMSRTGDLAEAGRWPSDWVEAYRRGYSDRAARAPADSVTAPSATCPTCKAPCTTTVNMRGGEHGWGTTDLERTVYHYAPTQTADSVLEDAERYRWLREPRLAAGQGSITVELDDRANGRFSRSIFLAELDAAIDAARAAQEGK